MLRCLLLAIALLAACQPAASTLTPPPVARILNYWLPVEDTLVGETQAWQFVGQAGDAVRLRVLGAGVSLALRGADDAVVPPDIVARFVGAHGGRLEVLADFDHDCCWARDWAQLLRRVPLPEDGP